MISERQHSEMPKVLKRALERAAQGENVLICTRTRHRLDLFMMHRVRPLLSSLRAEIQVSGTIYRVQIPEAGTIYFRSLSRASDVEKLLGTRFTFIGMIQSLNTQTWHHLLERGMADGAEIMEEHEG